jgi:N-acetylneuraminate synthase
MNLRTIPHMSEAFGVPVGLSDHTLGIPVPVAAVALGACIVEKHFTLSRAVPGPDSAFSLEPDEFQAMVEAIRTTELALGQVSYEVTEAEMSSRVFRRSLFVTRDMKAGEQFTHENVRSIRPGHGLQTRHLEAILGRRATEDIPRGTPLAWTHVLGDVEAGRLRHTHGLPSAVSLSCAGGSESGVAFHSWRTRASTASGEVDTEQQTAGDGHPSG